MQRKVFISYSRKDQDQVDPIADELTHLGFSVWKDTSNLQGGADWIEEIVRAISDCDFFLFFKSINSINSKTVQKEVRIANNKQRRIIPVILDNAPYSENLEFYIGNLQYIDSKRLDWKLKLLTALGTHPGSLGPTDEETEVEDLLQETISRLKSNRASKEDIDAILRALVNGQLSYEAKTPSIEIGGNVAGIIIVGNNNVIGLSQEDLNNLTATRPGKLEQPKQGVEDAAIQETESDKEESKSAPGGEDEIPARTGQKDDSQRHPNNQYIRSKRYYFKDVSTYADERWFEQEIKNSKNGKQATLCVVNGIHGIGKTWLLQYLRSSRNGIKQQVSRLLSSAPSIYYIDLGKRHTKYNDSPQMFVKNIRDSNQDFNKVTTLLIDSVPAEADDHIRAFEKDILVPHLMDDHGTVVMALQEISWPWEIIPNDSGKIEMKGWDNNSLEEYIKTQQVNNQQIIWYKSKFQNSGNHIPLLIEYVIKLSALKGIEQYLEDCLKLGDQNDDLLPTFALLAFTNEPRSSSFNRILDCVLSYELDPDATELFARLRNLRWIDVVENDGIQSYKWVEPIRTALMLWLEQNYPELYQKARSCL